jgi:hypothetical protein
MARTPTNLNDAVPCKHLLRGDDIERARDLLTSLPLRAPDALAAAEIPAKDWDMLLRAAVESLRGTNAATTIDKRRFIAAVLKHLVAVGEIREWSYIGTSGRQDYMVTLSDGTMAAIEAKGGPDGNNMTIWDRPSWAQEFVIWSLSPESLAKQPGRAIWSGVATRLLPRMVHESRLVDAFVFFDGRCGSSLRPCPKRYGVSGSLRLWATDVPGVSGRENWLPPPCVYLFPRTYPHIPDTPSPPTRTIDECKTARALLSAFGVPPHTLAEYAHSVDVHARGTSGGTEIRVGITSRCWPDAADRRCSSDWKPLKRH